MKRALTGARLLEVPSPDSHAKTDRLAEKIRGVLAGERVTVVRPTKRAELTVRGHHLGGAACACGKGGRRKRGGRAAVAETGALIAPTTPARPPSPMEVVEGAVAAGENPIEAPKELRPPKRIRTDCVSTAAEGKGLSSTSPVGSSSAEGGASPDR
ncbi:hypothetical protein X777_02178 [Ooceraea biroi]|uniref:Uncharacterized protein n=1 Tax=Ooceraea biroi TaxID=2015173 RepID=A0A026WPR6_OOCBI|nr:hypothetical protein X777_02178 [Ooceraea biroi]